MEVNSGQLQSAVSLAPAGLAHAASQVHGGGNGQGRGWDARILLTTTATTTTTITIIIKTARP